MTNTSSRTARTALVAQSNFSPFGNKLIQAGYVTIEQLQKSQQESRSTGKPLTEVLEAITGEPLAPELLRHYKKQQLFELMLLYGLAAFDPEIRQVPSQQIAYLIDRLIPIETCRRNRIVPLFSKETHLGNQLIKSEYTTEDKIYQALQNTLKPEAKSFTEELEELTGETIPSNLMKEYQQQQPFLMVGMVNPDNLAARDEIKNQILRYHGGVALQRLVITTEDYEKLISEYSDEQAKKAKLQAEKDEKKKLDFKADDFSEGDLEEAPEDAGEIEDVSLMAAQAEDAPVIRAVNVILAKALSEGVSDIHVEPQEEHIQIRMRKDGVLQEYYRIRI